MSKQTEALKLALEALEEINKLSIGENAICLPAEIDTAMDAIREALAEQPAQRKPMHIGDESAAFKAWFDAWWVGDGEQGETIPTQSDKHFLTYLDQYTLGFGAWMAAKHAAHGITGEQK